MITTTIDKGFIWNHGQTLLPITTIMIPLALEIIAMSSKIYQDPGCIQRNAQALKSKINSAFLQQPGETDQFFKKRHCLNCVKAVAGVALFGACAALPFIALPFASAIPTALAAVQTLGRIYAALPKICTALSHAKDLLATSFQAYPQESAQAFQERRWQAIKKIFVCSLIFTAALGGVAAAGYIGMLYSRTSSIWAIVDILPGQTKHVVLAEYLAEGALHLIQAALAAKKGEHSKTAFHLSVALASVIFPLKYLSEKGVMRLHHSFTGLLLMLAPWRSVKNLGAFIAFDSALYFFPRSSNYDCMNLIFDNFSYVLTTLTAFCAVQLCADSFTPKQAFKNAS